MQLFEIPIIKQTINMKKTLFFSLLLLAASLSCNPDQLEPEDYFFSCKVNTVEFKKTGITTYADNLLEGTLTLTFEEGDERILFIINDYDEEGIYTGTYMSYSKGVTSYYADDAVVTVTNINRENIQGTFYGTADDLSGIYSVVITEGEFRLKYDK